MKLPGVPEGGELSCGASLVFVLSPRFLGGIQTSRLSGVNTSLTSGLMIWTASGSYQSQKVRFTLLEVDVHIPNSFVSMTRVPCPCGKQCDPLKRSSLQRSGDRNGRASRPEVTRRQRRLRSLLKGHGVSGTVLGAKGGQATMKTRILLKVMG